MHDLDSDLELCIRIIDKSGSLSLELPAGHGKTEMLARLAHLLASAGYKTLVLTHTHVGVNTVRSRLRRLYGNSASVSVRTIDSWMEEIIRYLPNSSGFDIRSDLSGRRYKLIREGVLKVLQNRHVIDMIRASAQVVLVDEYQDCDQYQHEFVKCLKNVIGIPIAVFGDPMQAVFRFQRDVTFPHWETEVTCEFPSVTISAEPYRWLGKNEKLGHWIREQRSLLRVGARIKVDESISSLSTLDSISDIARLDVQNNRDSWAFLTKWNPNAIEYLRAIGAPFVLHEVADNALVADLILSLDISDDALSIRLPSFIQSVALSSTPVDIVDLIAEHMSDRFEIGSAMALRRLLSCLLTDNDRWLHRRNSVLEVVHVLDVMSSSRGSITAQEALAIVRKRISRYGRYQGRHVVTRPIVSKGAEFINCIVDLTEMSVEEVYVSISRPTNRLFVLQ